MSRYLGESAMQWGLCLFALLPGCSEPFDRPELPDDLAVLDGAMQAQSAATASRASIPDASAASAASAGDGGTSLSSSRIVESRAARSSAEGSGDGSEDSDDEKEQTTAISEQAEAFGDLLTLRGGQISVTRGARVLLRCVGEKQTFGRSSEFSCQSMLQVMEKRGREEVVLAEEKGVADLSGFEADGGSSQSTHSLSLFPLRRVPALSLIRVEQSHEQNESLIERSSKSQTFYALGEGKLVKVFGLVTSSRDHLDADPELEHDEIETRVLRVGKTETNGLPDLEISETQTTMKERRSQRKRSRMRAVWNGEGYDVCPAKLDQSAHCGACGHRCAVGEGCCGQRCVALQSQHTAGLATIPVAP